jgi:hypothetical protein
MTAPRPGVNRPGMAEDGVFETHPAGPPGFRPGPAAWLVHPPWRKAQHSKLKELPSHRLAGEPGAWPVHLPLAAGGDMRTAQYAQTGAAVIPRLAAYPPRDSNPERRSPEERGSASWPRRACE